MPPISPDQTLLAAMLTYRRPAGSEAETAFVRRFLHTLPHNPTEDECGNIIVNIPNPDQSTPHVAWSCHTDTVHSSSGRQFPVYKPSTQTYSLPSTAPKAWNCLGADDTAGVWLMHQMIVNHKPGLYIFHYGEECGGIGSNHIASSSPELLHPIKAIIALDRKGTSSVITHQGSRCASDEFARSLAAQLPNCPNLQPDPTGLFTDTANYTSLVPECSNLSVGYNGAHSPAETLDAGFLTTLFHDLMTLDYDKLEIVRDPAVPDLDDPYDFFRTFHSDHRRDPNDPADFADLVQIVEENAEAVAALLVDLGYDAFTLVDNLGQAITLPRSGRFPH